MPVYFQRPENALKRANEFLEVGKRQPALDVLYDVIKSKKHRTWQKIHEPIMEKYLQLCVELRKSHLAKEGLYQYKNICQQVNIKSLEDVVRIYLKMAEDKTEIAKEESQQKVLDIEDLDQIQTPESVLLSAVSGEDTQDRTDRLMLTPWVKFLWESYRQCLDLLRNNSRVERLYHDIAQLAFKFCLQYTRKAEFRKLCDNLRMHLTQIQRHHNQSTAVNLSNPDSQAMHLETRLVQLDSAILMELWQEAFKAVEDIHGLFSLSKKPPKSQLMANYYQKVSMVFWKSGNTLFHACTLHRLFHLSREMRKNLSHEEMQRMATKVLLATLSIPLTPERTDIARLLDMDGIIMEKQRRLATLLGLQAPPGRQGLINDMVRYGVIQYVVPEVKDLYNWLEVEFHPLKLCGRVSKVLDWIKDQLEKETELLNYVPFLQNNTILRLLQQVAQVYQNIEFTRLCALVPFTDPFQLERAIVDAARHCDLQVRVDQTRHILSFGSNLNYSPRDDAPSGPYLQPMPSEQMRNQLTAMSACLTRALDIVRPASIVSEKEEHRKQAVLIYLKNARKEHQRVLERRQTIEERKERLENLNVARERKEQQQRQAAMKKLREEEDERLRKEARERENQRILQEHESIKRKHVRERLEQIRKTELGAKALKDLDIENLDELDPDFIMAKQVEQLEKEKRELQERLKNQEKKVDYYERAKRLEEISLLKKSYEEQREKDVEFWEQQEEERIATVKEEREKALEVKMRLVRMLDDKETFLKTLKESRCNVYKAKLKEFEEHLEEERKKLLAVRKEKRKEERCIRSQKDKEEQEQKIHEEQLKKEHEEKESEERERLEQEEKAYQEKLQKLKEQEMKQKQREQEIEERLRRKEVASETTGDSDVWRRTETPTDRYISRPTEGERDCWRRTGDRTQRDDDRPIRRRDDDGPPIRRPFEDRLPRRFDDGPPMSRNLDDRLSNRRGFDERPPMRWGPDDDRPSIRRAPPDDRPTIRWAPDDDRPTMRRAPDDDRTAIRRAPDDDRTPMWRAPDNDRTPIRKAPDNDRTWLRRGPDDDGPRLRRGPDDDGPRLRQVPDNEGPRPRQVPDNEGPRPRQVPDKDEPRPRQVPNDDGPRPRQVPNDDGPRPRQVPNDDGPRPRQVPNDDRPRPRQVPNDDGPRPRQVPNDDGPRPRQVPDNDGPRPWRMLGEDGPPSPKSPAQHSPDDGTLRDDGHPQRSFEDNDGPPRRELDDNPPHRIENRSSIRRGLDHDRGPRRVEDERPSRWEDNALIPDDDDDRDGQSGAWKPAAKPGGWREREKAREDVWRPPRDRPQPSDRDRDSDRFGEPDDIGDKRPPARDEGVVWRRPTSDDKPKRRDVPVERNRQGEDTDSRQGGGFSGRTGDGEERGGPSQHTEGDDAGRWRRSTQETREERQAPRRVPPQAQDADKAPARKEVREGPSKKPTRSQPDEDGWTTVRR
uniref:eukaryotic translation initiation factor 3 subunit A isoform X2 n=1 Tax=Myxine glutinosa TaxID=7769 RepID=UPI003590290B